MKNPVDILLTDHGSICLLRAFTKQGAGWLDENIGDDTQLWGDSIVVEPRYVEPILNGAMADGLTVNFA